MAEATYNKNQKDISPKYWSDLTVKRTNSIKKILLSFIWFGSKTTNKTNNSKTLIIYKFITGAKNIIPTKNIINAHD